MEMNVLLFCLMGGVVSADTDAAWQSMISQPLIACSIAGALMGDLALGSMVGLLLQLPYLAELPVGGARVSLGNLGAFIAAGLAVKLNQLFPGLQNLILLFAISYGVIVSRLAIPLQNWSRGLNLVLARRADLAAEKGNLSRISMLNYFGVLNSLFFGILFSAIFFFLGKYIVQSVVLRFPFQMSLPFLKPTLLGAGLGAMFWLFLKRNTFQYTLIGTVMSMIAFLIVWIY